MAGKQAGRDEHASIISMIDVPTFVLPAVLVSTAVIIGVCAPEAFGEGANATLDFLTTSFGWFYAIGVFALVGFCLWAAFGRFGGVRCVQRA